MGRKKSMGKLMTDLHEKLKNDSDTDLMRNPITDNKMVKSVASTIQKELDKNPKLVDDIEQIIVGSALLREGTSDTPSRFNRKIIRKYEENVEAKEIAKKVKTEARRIGEKDEYEQAIHRVAEQQFQSMKEQGQDTQTDIEGSRARENRLEELFIENLALKEKNKQLEERNKKLKSLVPSNDEYITYLVGLILAFAAGCFLTFMLVNKENKSSMAISNDYTIEISQELDI